ncbi:protein of unknown function [Nitrosomonas sp. PY1]|uniref:DUF3617 domain-containing protein n=1 Tax=Nitrosomonas sp. PY1 TaxID=1803906 RepID=UPI001FC8B344|nr:DUF3617 domain-containing protein [Nitrosomonas sp. PY1]GKS69930.1 protein of unknown function [Nitrosomonas sp. PY1]
MSLVVGYAYAMKVHAVLVLFGIFMSFSVFAHEHIRVGLWEVTTRSDLLALVPHIPSENMQQLQKLANQYGIKMPKIDNGAVISHICITAEMAQQEIPTYFYENRSGCTVQNATRIGNSYKMDLSCKNSHFQGNGTAQGTFITTESFAGSTEFDSAVNGAPMFVSAETKAHWVGEYCTAVNPLQ